LFEGTEVLNLRKKSSYIYKHFCYKWKEKVQKNTGGRQKVTKAAFGLLHGGELVLF